MTFGFQERRRKEKQGTHDGPEDGVRSREVLESFVKRNTRRRKTAVSGERFVRSGFE
jgi:hypothetical protein